MRILVVDDSVANRQAALEGLKEHEVTVCEFADQAISAIQGLVYKKKPFDILMTDQWMVCRPESTEHAEAYGQKYGTGSNFSNGTLPLGTWLALLALELEVPTVVIYSDVYHHGDPALLWRWKNHGAGHGDFAQVLTTKQGCRLFVVEQEPIKGVVKDWARVLKMIPAKRQRKS